MSHTSIFDAQGHRQVRYHRVETYYKNIRLDDGTVLTIKDSSKFEDFRIGMKVYVGIAPGAHLKGHFYIIQGNEADAVWSWVD